MKYLIVLLIGMSVFMTGCVETVDGEYEQKTKTTLALNEMNRQVGMPNIVNFQEKKVLKLILEERDRANLVCYVYLKSEYTGKLIYIGRSIGYGFPYATQYTNPMKIEYVNGSVVVPQADPNGLYAPSSAAGTWLMMLDAKGIPHPVYIEPEILVSPFKLEV